MIYVKQYNIPVYRKIAEGSLEKTAPKRCDLCLS